MLLELLRERCTAMEGCLESMLEERSGILRLDGIARLWMKLCKCSFD